MRTFFSFNMMSLDGFFEGPGASLDWHRVDEEFGRFALEQLASIDTLVFGRRTYEMMAAFWTSAEALKADPLTAEAMNSRPKLIFSRTLKSVGWHNSRLAGPDLAAEINALKAAPGRDIALFGSAALMAALAPLNVIDEHRVMINPLLLGAGTPLFQGPAAQGTLRLLRTRTFGNGNILLSYAPAA